MKIFNRDENGIISKDLIIIIDDAGKEIIFDISELGDDYHVGIKTVYHDTIYDSMLDINGDISELNISHVLSKGLKKHCFVLAYKTKSVATLQLSITNLYSNKNISDYIKLNNF